MVFNMWSMFFGFNYKPLEYATFKKENPDVPLIGSETFRRA